MKSLNEYITEGRKQASEIMGDLGEVLGKHYDELNKLKNYDQIEKFLDGMYDELNDSAKKYVDDEVRPALKATRGNYIKAYHYLYDIYLAGFRDSRIGSR